MSGTIRIADTASDVAAPNHSSIRLFRYPKIPIPMANIGQSKQEQAAQPMKSQVSPTTIYEKKMPNNAVRKGTSVPIQNSPFH